MTTLRSRERPRCSPNPDSTFRDIVGDYAFQEQREAGVPARKAFGAVALELADIGTSESGYSCPDVDRQRVAAYVDSFVDSKKLIESNRVNNKDYATAMSNIIQFNHSLATMIDNDKGASRREVLHFLTGLYGRLHPKIGNEDKDEVRGMFGNTLKGMTQEIIAEQMLGYLGYEVEDNSDLSLEERIKEETRGVDRYVLIDEEWWSVDIKATSYTANIARAKHPGNVILATDVSEETLNGMFRLMPADLESNSRRFKNEIERELKRVRSLK